MRFEWNSIGESKELEVVMCPALPIPWIRGLIIWFSCSLDFSPAIAHQASLWHDQYYFLRFSNRILIKFHSISFNFGILCHIFYLIWTFSILLSFRDAGMRFVVGDYWRDLFDVIIVNARKPKFFYDSTR